MDDEEVPIAAVSPEQHPKFRRFSLDTLPPQIANMLKEFDFDGDGKVTLEEVQKGVEILKKTKRKHKIALWAMVIQFLVYAILSALSCAVLYHYIYLMKDTTVDPVTGNMLVQEAGTNAEVEVSVKQHGTSFRFDHMALDPVTGDKIGCFIGEQVEAMFSTVSEGSIASFVGENFVTGDYEVLPLNVNGASWTNSSVKIGDLILYPDLECTEKLYEINGVNRRRSLSVEELYDELHESHMAFRDAYIASYRNGGDAQGRRRMQMPLEPPAFARLCKHNCN